MSDEPIVYLNGAFLPESQARLTVFDQGLQFGDGIYEVISATSGVLFKLDAHLDRLDMSLHATRILPKLSREDWRQAVIGMVRRSGLRDAAVKIIVTRGVQPPGTSDPRLCTPNVIMTAVPYIWLGNERQRREGIKLAISPLRGMSPDTLDPRYKHISRLQYQIMRIEALEAGYDDAAWMSADGHVQECPKSNLFMARGGTLYTPSEGILHGITRATILEIAAREGIPAVVGNLTAFDLYNAEEVFTCSTSGGALPVREVQGRPVRGPVPGSMTNRINEVYWRLRAEGWHGTPVHE
jgi:branched-chain amino acid aminotransferase